MLTMNSDFLSRKKAKGHLQFTLRGLLLQLGSFVLGATIQVQLETEMTALC